MRFREFMHREDYDPNATPSGPEFKSTMPAGTVSESEDQPKPHLYLDMDGVQADFFLQWAKMFGFKNYRDMGDVAAQTANIMKLVDKGDEFVEEFFATLPMLKGGAKLLAFLHQNKIPYTILSAPLRLRYDASTAGKRRWLDQHTPGVSQNAIFTSDKHKYAVKGGRANVLVDDHGEKIAKWQAKGGIGIKHDDATTDSTIEQLSKIYLQ